MQREKSRRIAKLYEFTGKAGPGSMAGWGIVRMGRGRKYVAVNDAAGAR
jgi:hypothetical protein